MKRWGLVVALLASLGVNLGLVGAEVVRARRAAAWAGEAPEPGGPEPGSRLAERLRLAGAERERFVALQRRLAEAVRKQRGELGRLRLELRAELIAETPRPERIDRLLAEVGERQRELDRAFVDNVLESRGQLSGRSLEAYLRFVERFAQPRPAGDGEPLRERLERFHDLRHGGPGRPGERPGGGPPEAAPERAPRR